MKKIAILSSHPIQYSAPLYAHLSKNPNLDLTVLYCSDFGTRKSYDEGFQQEFQWDIDLLDGYKYEFLGNKYFLRRPAGFFSLICPSIISTLYKNKYDAVWIHGHNYLVNILAIIFSKMFGSKVFIRCETHLGLSRSNLKILLRPFILKIIYGFCDAFLAIGENNKNFYLSLGIPDSKIFITPYTIDNNRFTLSIEKARAEKNVLLKEIGIHNNNLNILYISKLQKRKRPDALILAASKIKKQLDFNLIITGSGEMLNECKKLGEDLKISNLFFPGFINQEKVPSFYAIADIFTLLSEDEPWGLVINEAMSAALPIVATEEIGSMADLVDSENGFQISKDRLIDETSVALSSLLESKELRDKMGRASLKKIQNWNFKSTESGLMKALYACQ